MTKKELLTVLNVVLCERRNFIEWDKAVTILHSYLEQEYATYEQGYAQGFKAGVKAGEKHEI
jgi:hypothetical protein